MYGFSQNPLFCLQDSAIVKSSRFTQTFIHKHKPEKVHIAEMYFTFTGVLKIMLLLNIYYYLNILVGINLALLQKQHVYTQPWQS